MSATASIPRILVIDDVCGRTLSTGRNSDRVAMCHKYGLLDVTGDEASSEYSPRQNPLAEAVFLRGQTPARATTGDTVHNDLDGCLRIIEQGWDVPPGRACWSLILLDLCFYTGLVTSESELNRGTGMPEGRTGDNAPDSYFGFDILRAIHARWPDLPVVILSSMPRESAQRQFSSYGALAFLERNAEPTIFTEYLWRHGLFPDESGRIVGRSKPLLFALRQARRMAAQREHVLIRGPRGSGKELMARFLFSQHEQMGTSGKQTPFVQVNCGAIDPTGNLHLSDLFGHGRGAFTGAQVRRGRLREADGGYLFMDEIGALPSSAQDGILRVIEYGDFYPVGSDVLEKADVCFVSSTNEDIEKRATTGGGFRPDLLDRLRRGGTLVVPSLQERKDDIALLAQSCLKELQGQTRCVSIRDDTLEILREHDWPGNIRTLKSCLVNALLGDARDVEELCPHHIHLPGADQDSLTVAVAAPADLGLNTPDVTLEELLNTLDQFDFSRLRGADLVGQLGPLQHHCASFIARYLKATLEATADHVAQRVQIHPAIKMALGDKSVKATKAADIIKSILKDLHSGENDDVLQEAYEAACRIRRHKRQK